MLALPPAVMTLGYSSPFPTYAGLFASAVPPPASVMRIAQRPEFSSTYHVPPPSCTALYCSAAEGDPQYEEMSAVEVAMQGVVLERGIERGQLLVRGRSGATGGGGGGTGRGS